MRVDATLYTYQHVKKMRFEVEKSKLMQTVALFLFTSRRSRKPL